MVKHIWKKLKISKNDKFFKVIKSFLKNLFKVFYNSIIGFLKNDGIEHSGYIAFNMVLSLFPFMIFVIFILGLVGQTPLGMYFTETIISIFPKDMVDTIVPKMEEIAKSPPPSFWSLAFLSILWTISSLVEGIRTSLNKIYRVQNIPHYIWGKLLSIAQFFMITVTMIISVFGLIIIPKIIQKINLILLEHNYEVNIIWIHIRGSIMYLITFIMISLVYYIIPNKKQKIEFVFPGALVTLVGWIISGKLLSFYLKSFNEFSLIYGSLGGVIISLIFFYVVSAVFLYGAQFNYHFGEKFLNKYVKKLNLF